MQKVAIVIAAYNEQKNIGKVVTTLKKKKYNNIIVVDDGSKDQTAKKAKEAGATVIKHIINLGQGAALKTGIDFAIEENADVIVTFDADGQHKAKEVEKVIAPIKKGKIQVVLGSRFLKKTDVPPMRAILLKGSIIIQGLFYGVWLSDAHNGFRALSRKAAKKIQIRSNRMAHASEIVEEIKRNKLKYKEVPVTIMYSEQSLKKGHGSYLGAIKVFLKMIYRKLVN